MLLNSKSLMVFIVKMAMVRSLHGLTKSTRPLKTLIMEGPRLMRSL